MTLPSYFVPDWVDDGEVTLKCGDDNSEGWRDDHGPQRGSRDPDATNELIIETVTWQPHVWRHGHLFRRCHVTCEWRPPWELASTSWRKRRTCLWRSGSWSECLSAEYATINNILTDLTLIKHTII